VGLPDLAELNDWRRRARVCIRILKDTSPDAIVAYLNSLDSRKDQRLIRSM
jgi:hypothetical protein